MDITKGTTQIPDLTHMVPEFPIKPVNEIPKDPLIRHITKELGETCRQLLIVNGSMTGKSNFLAQFCRHHKGRAISYFVTPNPITQDLKNYLYVISNQINWILHKKDLPLILPMEHLVNAFSSLSARLASYSKTTHENYYFVIDGLDHCIRGVVGNRIVDHNPLSFTSNLYTLYSCRPETVHLLPQDLSNLLTIRDDLGHSLEFSYTDTNQYLSDQNLSIDEINIIHEKSGGLPGYIRVMRDTIRSAGEVAGFVWTVKCCL